MNNIKSGINYIELLNLLFQIYNKEQCINNNNTNKKDEICLLCSEIEKFKSLNNYTINNNDTNKIINGKILLNNEDFKFIKSKVKIKKNKSNFINPDIGLKLFKLNSLNKIKKNSDNQTVTNNSHDKKLFNYFKTTIDEKLKISTLNSHRDFEIGNKEHIYTDLKNFIQNKNNNKKKTSNQSMNKIYNYCHKNKVINIKTSNILEKNNLNNYIKEKFKKLSYNNNQKNSNLNINNNQHIYFYPKVEQYLNNIYIINDNDNKNGKYFKEENKNIIDSKNKDIVINKDDENKNESKENINLHNYIEIINDEINLIDNISNNFKLQTLQIKKKMLEIGKKM
jgi:hypothetical protein